MSTNHCFDWAVIGAGPAGIAAVGRLIDYGISPQQIVWIDPTFKVGDFGSKWHCVSSNTKVSLFNQFLQESPAFNYNACPDDYAIHHIDSEKTCDLYWVAKTLQWVTWQLQKKVHCLNDFANKIVLRNRCWEITLTHDIVHSKKIILAIGSEPETLQFTHPQTIPLDVALDKTRLQNSCDKNDVVAVFGSSHSAIIILRQLLEQGVKQVINFYRSPQRYAVYLDDFILFDDTGLKGTTAEWAREHVDGKLPDGLTRVFSSSKNVQHYLPQCTKAVYAVGFKRRELPLIEDFPEFEYNDKSGIIAPGLFGFGIAFPEAKINPFGMQEYSVGLWKFMDYLNRVLPIWMRYSA